MKTYYKFFKQGNGRGNFASIRINIEEATTTSKIAFLCVDVYKVWKESILLGIAYALKKSDKHFIVEIEEVLEVIVDTTASAMGYAAIRAVWQGINYQPEEQEILKLEKYVFAYKDNFPDFDSLD